jgi:hypothetical protein
VAAICRKAVKPGVISETANGLVGSMPGAFHNSVRAKTIFHGEAEMAGWDAMRNIRKYSGFASFVFGIFVGLGLICAGAVGLHLNVNLDARINVKVTEGVSDPKVAAICRKAVKPGVISETATRLGA